MRWLIPLGLLAGGYAWHRHVQAGKSATTAAVVSAASAPDPGMDAATVAALNASLASETDPGTLRTFAAKLEAAGFPHSAAELLAKAHGLDGQ